MADDAAPATSTSWSRLLKGYVLCLLCLSAFMSVLDRQIVGVLLESIKHDLHASDTEMGLLSGVYFSIFYLIAGIPLARLADTTNRRNLIALSLVAWSAATMACGLTATYLQLAVTRTLVAVGEAGCSPASASIISNAFAPRVRTRALSVLTWSC